MPSNLEGNKYTLLCTWKRFSKLFPNSALNPYPHFCISPNLSSASPATSIFYTYSSVVIFSFCFILYFSLDYHLPPFPYFHTARKMDLILRSIERRLQMQFSTLRRKNRKNVILRLTHHALRKLQIVHAGGELSSDLWVSSLVLYSCATFCNKKNTNQYIFAIFLTLRILPHQ
jgi:hypothetical protein